MRSEPEIRHVLLDADGVLQDLPGGWYAAMEPYVGERAREFLHRTWIDELPMLAGRGDYGVHLATNQECYRGAHMRTVLGYDDLFDVSCYSYDLGVAKPDPEFFAKHGVEVAI
ncbi:hypothetical protein [Kribbella italica]|uniref:FMN phosphatase YigB (HAD superfamily) n=1 Tax=Kribbella italica TaxID=1540520 RepID=A0A7W9MYL5_9ACTN|nr:hypothetical protein [Kribbella italica]MBB5840959.1 FMN phosphatase YigB (HAD superfamily) [Kribbella italica]